MTLFRYPGGKTQLASHIVEQLGITDCYYEPFVGGGSVLCEVAKCFPAAKLSVNDLDPNVAGFWKLVASGQTSELVYFYELLARKPTVDLFVKLRGAAPSSMGTQAYYAVFFSRTTFSGVSTAGPIGGYAQTGRWKIDCRYKYEKLRGKMDRLVTLMAGRLTATNQHFARYIERVPNGRAMYVDPPYYAAGRKIYQYYMSVEEHVLLAKLLRARSGWVLSYDTHEEIKQLYTWASKTVIDHQYYMQRGGKERKVNEFLITAQNAKV